MKRSVLYRSSPILVGVVLAGVFVADSRPTEAEPAVAADTFKVDGVHSAMVFKVRYSGLSNFYGRFNEFSGSFAVDESDLANSRFDIRVKTASVDSGNKKRDAHLSSPDFFSAKQHPEISFVSKKVKVVKGKQLEVTGDLTLRGVTKSVVANVTYGGQKTGGRGGNRAGFDGTMKIKREDFGITFGGGMLGSEVTIEMGLTGLEN